MINSVGNYYRPVAYQAQRQFERQIQPSFKGEENKKEGMSKTSKTLLGLGALAAVGIGALLLKKPSSSVFSKEFSDSTLTNLLKRWGLEEGQGGVVLIKKANLGSQKFVNMEKVNAMSDNGFVLVRNNPSTGKLLVSYHDPIEISCSRIKEAMSSEELIVPINRNQLIL